MPNSDFGSHTIAIWNPSAHLAHTLILCNFWWGIQWNHSQALKMLIFADIEVKSDCLEASNLRRPFRRACRDSIHWHYNTHYYDIFDNISFIYHPSKFLRVLRHVVHGGGQRDRHPQGPGDDGVWLYVEAFITNHMEHIAFLTSSWGYTDLSCM